MTDDEPVPGADATDVRIRRARHDDYESVVAFTEDTWSEREDYLPDVFHDWVDADGPDQRTFVACEAPGASGSRTASDDADAADAGSASGGSSSGGDVVGLVQAVRLSAYEAWYQGMRVHPEYRGRGVSAALNRACVDWSRGWGATVGRLMVFSWNVQGLGAARANGFEPGTAFRWMHPEPDSDATPEGRVVEDPDVVYAYWTDSEAREHLGGLALDFGETWACSELTRADLERAASETRVFAVQGDRADGRTETRGATVRVRDYERDGERRVEYGVAAWEDVDALGDLLAVVARDAADLGADDVRVLIPETARHVSDAAYAGVDLADEPDFVLAADLSAAN